MTMQTAHPASAVPAVQALDLYRFYRAGDEETLALRGISLTVHGGEVVAVTGPSGSGKSTVLALLAGLDEPDGGSVRLAGERISHLPEAQRTLVRRRLVGVLRQSGNLVEHLDVRTNVALVQSLRGRGTTPRRTVPDLLELVGLGHRARAMPGTLSGGELARAGLAVALAGDPAVLIADEPTGELDLATEHRVLDLIRLVAAEGAAVVVASHSAEVAAGADRVLRLTDGRWVAAEVAVAA
ncbi:ATP-binding cassette domain-containing protein [Blastococcus sp. CT_GayMR16]|uniref:ABC transporter ATP-binding protein n=1 Tax=Blastococcus sp. CT_GayMR16 TaxID=2559607 RepID=UPI00107383A6|nr:ATP-binding cassette domain-containing protein [Blastococcus sp. CT_GayMR16]TFV91087.1 ATP-binding cassette domain-containing protein [Blastococcus sp. CT_GayMR16]